MGGSAPVRTPEPKQIQEREHTVPIFNYLPLHSLSALDKRRHRVAVWVQPDGEVLRLFLGDVWCSVTTGRWHFTVGATNLQKQRGTQGFTTRDEAAAALLADRQQQSAKVLHKALDQTNLLRQISALTPLTIAADEPSQETWHIRPLPHSSGADVQLPELAMGIQAPARGFDHLPPASRHDLAVLRQRAVVDAANAILITDAGQPHNPIIDVNPAFTALTGYPREAVLGRNCRFLQGPGTDPAAVAALREAIATNCPEPVTLLNYRADGTSFWNEITIAPLRDGQDQARYFVGIQRDVSA